MKKYLIFSILSLIFLLPALPASAIKRIHANPINIASQLALQQDSAEIVSTLQYYGYTPSASHNAKHTTQNAEDGLAVFTHPDGTTITISFHLKPETPKPETTILYPTVQVNSKISKTETEKILENLNYAPSGIHYELKASKYSKYLTKCTLGPGKTVTFQRRKK